MHWEKGRGLGEASDLCVHAWGAQGKGVDVIVDIVGAPYLEKDLDCLAMDGRVIFIGWMGGGGRSALPV